MRNNHRIEGAVALVTGANRGLGRALTEALLARGAKKVYAAARHPEALRAQRDERLVPLRLDVTDAEQVRAASEAASDVTLVFNNAAVALARGIADPASLDGVEAGDEDIFPDPFAVEFGLQFGSSPKGSERQVAALTAAMLPEPAACCGTERNGR